MISAPLGIVFLFTVSQTSRSLKACSLRSMVFMNKSLSEWFCTCRFLLYTCGYCIVPVTSLDSPCFDHCMTLFHKSQSWWLMWWIMCSMSSLFCRRKGPFSLVVRTCVLVWTPHTSHSCMTTLLSSLGSGFISITTVFLFCFCFGIWTICSKSSHWAPLMRSFGMALMCVLWSCGCGVSLFLKYRWYSVITDCVSCPCVTSLSFIHVSCSESYPFHLRRYSLLFCFSFTMLLFWLVFLYSCRCCESEWLEYSIFCLCQEYRLYLWLRYLKFRS